MVQRKLRVQGVNGEVRWASELSDNRGYSDEALGTDELLIALFMDLGKDFLESSLLHQHKVLQFILILYVVGKERLSPDNTRKFYKAVTNYVYDLKNNKKGIK